MKLIALALMFIGGTAGFVGFTMIMLATGAGPLRGWAICLMLTYALVAGLALAASNYQFFKEYPDG
jgi:hypothetical protein